MEDVTVKCKVFCQQGSTSFYPNPITGGVLKIRWMASPSVFIQSPVNAGGRDDEKTKSIVKTNSGKRSIEESTHVVFTVEYEAGGQATY